MQIDLFEASAAVSTKPA